MLLLNIYGEGNWRIFLCLWKFWYKNHENKKIFSTYVPNSRVFGILKFLQIFELKLTLIDWKRYSNYFRNELHVSIFLYFKNILIVNFLSSCIHDSIICTYISGSYFLLLIVIKIWNVLQNYSKCCTVELKTKPLTLVCSNSCCLNLILIREGHNKLLSIIFMTLFWAGKILIHCKCCYFCCTTKWKCKKM